MNLCKAGCVLTLCAGVAVLTAAPLTARAQDRAQQDQHGTANENHAQKPQQSHATRPQKTQAARPQQSQATRPQQSHTAARPQQTHAARPQQSQTARPQQTHAARPQQGNAGRPQQSHAARPQQGNAGRPQQNHNTRAASQGNRQTNRGQQARPNYQFRSQDSGRLRQYYRGGFGRIDRHHRPRFSRGGYIPRTYWGDFQPVPGDLIGYLPAVPPGYAIGYYDGYVVVYDPVTYMIVSVLDILQ